MAPPPMTRVSVLRFMVFLQGSAGLAGLCALIKPFNLKSIFKTDARVVGAAVSDQAADA